MQNISVYLNQRAANTSLEFWKNKINTSLFRSNLLFRTPSNLEELRKDLDSDIKNKVDAIVSVGGDGTVNTLIQNLANEDIALLVIPGGTANDLAHELGIEKNLKKLISAIRQNKVKEIDLIKINNRFMATNGGIGMGGNVADKINTVRQRYPAFKKIMKFTGKSIYSIFIAQELLSLKLERYNLFLKSKEFTGQKNCVALLINNQPMLAGTFNIAPNTCNSDGKVNICILSHQNRHQLLKCILTIARGGIPKNDPYFLTFETEALEVENLNPMQKVTFFGDGEVFDKDETNWKISVDRMALKVYSHKGNNDLLSVANEVNLS